MCVCNRGYYYTYDDKVICVRIFVIEHVIECYAVTV
jgi:hypothetical protein